MTLQQMIDSSDNIVFFGGAGVSTESGIPDYRSADGLYNQAYSHPPEVMLSRDFFRANPSEFYRFHRDKMIHTEAKPNAAHIALARLEQAGKLRVVITQNIDELHQQAGSKSVIELHGSVYKNYCTRCGKRFGVEAILEAADVPYCTCGGVIRPDVVLYQEQLDDAVVEAAEGYLSDADMLIVAGTSLAVYPAANLIHLYRGDKLALINLSETSADSHADLIIREKVGEVLQQLVL